MGGDGTIGGGKSCELSFTVKEKTSTGDVEKQKWIGTDPNVPSTFKLSITMDKAYTINGQPGGNKGDVLVMDVSQTDKKVVIIGW